MKILRTDKTPPQITISQIGEIQPAELLDSARKERGQAGRDRHPSTDRSVGKAILFSSLIAALHVIGTSKWPPTTLSG